MIRDDVAPVRRIAGLTSLLSMGTWLILMVAGFVAIANFPPECDTWNWFPQAFLLAALAAFVGFIAGLVAVIGRGRDGRGWLGAILGLPISLVTVFVAMVSGFAFDSCSDPPPPSPAVSIPEGTSPVTTIRVGHWPTDPVVLPDGSAAYVANFDDGTVSVIDTSTLQVTATVRVGQSPSSGVVLPDGSAVYVPCDGAVSVIDTATNKVTATIPVPSEASHAVVLPDGSAVYVLHFRFADSSMSVIDTTTNRLTATVPVGHNPFGQVVLPGGSAIYVSNRADHTISVIDTTTNQVTATIPIGSHPESDLSIGSPVVLPDGSAVYVPSDIDDTVFVLDTATNQVLTTIPVINPRSLAVSADGAVVYVLGTDAAVSAISTTGNQVTNAIPVDYTPSYAAALPDGSALYVTTGGRDGDSLVEITTATNQATARFTVGDGALRPVPLPDGSAVYVANHASGSVSVIDRPDK